MKNVKTMAALLAARREGNYPFVVDPTWIQEDYRPMPLDKVFETGNGNQELCHATGRWLENGEHISDHWDEYVDSLGDFHYGR